MGKRKEIKFRRDGRVYEGRQNGVIFRLYEDRDKIKTCAPAYSVTAVDTKNEGREICTAGHQYFHMDAAKEFCQQIAAGEIDLETLQEKFAAEAFGKWIQSVAAAVEAQHEMETALRWARCYNRPLYNRYTHTKKKRTRKKYAKRILEWYRTEVAPC